MANLKNVVYSVLIIYVTITVSQKCPDECDCRETRVNCIDHSLKEIPELPATTTSLAIIGKPNSPFSISRLRRLDFKNIPNLTQLFIVFAGVTTIDPDAFQDLKQLKGVELKFNKISTIYQSTFSGLTNLESIDLSGNRYCDLQTGAVANLPSLRNLYLSDMRMRSLDVSSFKGLDSLLHLDLSGNSLRQMDKDILEPLKSLTSLGMTNNRLKGLDESMMSPLSKLESLHLGSNPWQCNCHIKWFKKLPLKFIYDITSFGDDTVICNGPTHLHFKNLKDVSDDQLACVKPTIKDCRDVKALKGSEAMITCNITGDPFPDLTWTQPDQKSIDSLQTLNPSEFEYLENGTLVIKSLRYSQNGTWDISVKNVVGQDKTIMTVHVLRPNVAPAITDCQDITENTGDPAIIMCNITGNPFPIITWTLPSKSKIHSEKNVDSMKYELQVNGALLIKSLARSDEGRWEVMVENNLGQERSLLFVKVLDLGVKPTITDCKDVEGNEGEDIGIECVIKGEPFPNITWTLPDDSEIQSTSAKRTSKYDILKKGTLLIKKLEANQDGKWTIFVKNKFGDDTAFVKVKITKLKSDAAPPLNMGIIIGAGAGGGVALICLIVIIAVCFKNKKNQVDDFDRDGHGRRRRPDIIDDRL